MTNDKFPRNDQIRMTKPATAQLRAIGHSGFGFLWALGIVIQRVMQIRFMVPMRAKKASGVSMNSPRAVAGRDSVLDCGSPLPLFLARVGWESARSQGEHTCRKHFFVSFFAGLWLTMQCLEKTSVRGFLLSGTDFIRRRKSSSVRQRFPSSTHCSRPRPAPFDRDRQLWRGVAGPQRSRFPSRGESRLSKIIRS